MKKCEFCAEKIQDDAVKCRFCGESLQKPKTSSMSCVTGCLIVFISALIWLFVVALALFLIFKFVLGPVMAWTFNNFSLGWEGLEEFMREFTSANHRFELSGV